MDWSGAQLAALGAVERWLNEQDKQVFRIFGYAGTGKTTLAREFAAGRGGKFLFGAFTGKAALVMKRRGCWGATTIHKMIYRPKEKSEQHLKELEAQFAACTDQDRRRELLAEIEMENENLKRPAFSLNLDSEVRTASCVVVDEVSMIGESMGRDLISFGVPLLVLGDPAQLPPVADGGYFTEAEPDVMLTEIHRQAEGSPIIRLASLVRSGRALPLGSHEGEGHEASLVLRRGTLTLKQLAEEFDQVLCGKNATRRSINARFREAAGRKSHLPEPGDRLVCLRNNGTLGLLNGSLWEVADSCILNEDRVGMSIVELDSESDVPLDVEAHRHHFEGREIPYWQRREADEFDFGYALTVHKAQGSQWPRVCLVDESAAFRQHAARWLYTGITRAEDHVTVVT